MSHSVTPQNSRRRPSSPQVLGAALVAAGLVFAVFAIIALSKPNGAAEKSGGPLAVSGTGSPPPPVVEESASTATPAPSAPAGPATPDGSASPAGSEAPAGSAAPAGSPAPVGSATSVVILNNTNIAGLAARARADLQARGWTVTDVTNYSNDIISTAAYYDPSEPANQQAALALQQQFPWIKRVVPRFPQLPDSPIVLVLNAAY